MEHDKDVLYECEEDGVKYQFITGSYWKEIEKENHELKAKIHTLMYENYQLEDKIDELMTRIEEMESSVWGKMFKATRGA